MLMHILNAIQLRCVLLIKNLDQMYQIRLYAVQCMLSHAYTGFKKVRQLFTYFALCLSQAAKVNHLPELDEEIDILSSIISKHRESEMKHSGKTPYDLALTSSFIK